MKKKYSIYGIIYILFFGNLFLCAEICAAQDPFPLYPSIERNVDFWTDIYSKYPTTQGILHDSIDLHIVYDVIELLASERHGARKENRKRIKNAKKKYKKILENLAKSSSASEPEAKRLAALFGPDANPATFQKAIYRIRCQIGQKDRFREGLIRSGAYIDEIKEIFHSNGLPEDLAFLPHVESSFNPRAYSKFGAAGIWQFTRSTGKRLMTVGYVLDERRDPIRSSKAAAQLLKQNYKKIKSWPMAITAYNHGITGMLRAKRSKGSYEAIFKGYRSRIFKFASRNFYSEFLAAREVAINYERYFGALEFDRPAEIRKVVVEGYASIKNLSSHFKVDIATMRWLNPALRPPVFEGQKYVPKGYALRLPVYTAHDLPDSSVDLANNIYKSRQKPSRFHRVKKGDTVAKIARIHGLKTSDLILANNLNSRGTIYINRNLRLPVPDESPSLMAYTRGKEKMPEAAPLLSSGEISKTSQTATMAKQHTPSAYEAMITSPKLSTNPAVTAGNLHVEQVAAQPEKTIRIIRVENEETLGHYAEWLEIPTQEIRRLNGLSYRSVLRLHQEVKIPLDRVSKEQFEEVRFEYHQKIQEDFFGAYKVAAVQVYRVKNGDNIWTLCNEIFKMPFWLVKKYNPEVDFSDLRWSQKLMIPVAEKLVDGSPGTVVL